MTTPAQNDASTGDRDRSLDHDSGPITILLADRQVTVLRGLRMRLELETDFQVVGEANSLPLAKELIDRLQPEVVLLDASLIKGLTTTELSDLRKISPRTGLVLHVLHSLDARKRRILEEGSDLTLVKQDTGEALPNAIRELIEGFRASDNRSA
ncbi:MAG: hypothetical protein R3191_04395 [Anaerolineales bacterium]|nr:hypothetical protein [Anaerolineales bacterium]